MSDIFEVGMVLGRPALVVWDGTSATIFDHTSDVPTLPPMTPIGRATITALLRAVADLVEAGGDA